MVAAAAWERTELWTHGSVRCHCHVQQPGTGGERTLLYVAEQCAEVVTALEGRTRRTVGPDPDRRDAPCHGVHLTV